MVSTSSERGLTNCPANLPTLTTGSAAPKVSTTAICNSTRNVSRMLSGWNSAKLSAQSPPCSKNASPPATRPNWRFKLRASPANTKGGMRRSRASTLSSAAWSGYAGTCKIGFPRQLSGAHFLAISVTRFGVSRVQMRLLTPIYADFVNNSREMQ